MYESPWNASIGKITLTGEGKFQWTIDNFLSSVRYASYGVTSPTFDFADASHFLYVGFDRKENLIEVFFRKEDDSPLRRIHVRLGLRTGGRGKMETRSGEVNSYGNFAVLLWMSCTEFLEKRMQILREGTLTVFCELKRLDVEEPERVLGEAKAAAESSATDGDSDDEEKLPKLKNLLSLSDNFQQFFNRGEGCDVTLIVKGEKLQAHSAILQARSKVFSSMMTHDMVEKRSREVKIDDCEPGAVQELLHFLYTGKVENLTVDNMQHVYYTADKYEVADLKSDCVEFIQNSLTTEVVCEVIDLAVKHSEPDLLACAIEYFIENIDEVLETEQWQTFLKEHPVEGNELYIKALKRIRGHVL